MKIPLRLFYLFSLVAEAKVPGRHCKKKRRTEGYYKHNYFPRLFLCKLRPFVHKGVLFLLELLHFRTKHRHFLVIGTDFRQGHLIFYGGKAVVRLGDFVFHRLYAAAALCVLALLLLGAVVRRFVLRSLLLLLDGGVGLLLVAIVPQVLSGMMGVPGSVAAFFGGTSLLIIVGVALDTLRVMESHLLVRKYDGFLRHGSLRGRGGM